jgi:hypothetical protein
VAEKHGEISERHLELLRVTADLASNDPTAVAQIYTAAQRINLNTVGKKADRAEFLALVRALEEAGCVEVRGMGLAASYGLLCVTEEGHRQLAATSEPTEAAQTPAAAPGEAEQPRPSTGAAQEGTEPTEERTKGFWARLFGG